MKVVIVGAGLAGYTLAKELRKKDEEASITVVTRDHGDSYSKPMLSNALALGKTPISLIQASAEKMAAQFKLNIMTETDVLEIQRDQKQLVTSQGVVPYDTLVLAWGAEQLNFPIPGTGAGDIQRVNHVTDYATFRESLETSNRILIIGPGLIGCEFANDLTTVDKAVTVIGPDAWPLSTLLPEKAGLALQAAMERSGVEWQLGKTVANVDQEAGGYRVTLSDGSVLEADLVLSAIGLKPNVQLAQQAGLETARAIVTNEYGQTSDESIYAIGDCAQFGDRWLPYILPIMTAARAMSSTIAGDKTEIVFPTMPVAIKTPALPISLVPGPTGCDWAYESTDDGLVCRASVAGKPAGYVLMGPQKMRQALLKELL